jgi:hypothetical protein
LEHGALDKLVRQREFGALSKWLGRVNGRGIIFFRPPESAVLTKVRRIEEVGLGFPQSGQTGMVHAVSFQETPTVLFHFGRVFE